jgi:Reverse transcriptase (RNA-dependent DNA polymerase)
MLTSKKPNILHHLLLPAGTPVWTYLKDKKWHRCLVSEANKNFVTVRRHAKGPAMALAYEDLRIAPRSDVSIVAEAASLDDPELALSNSSSFRNEIADADIVSDSPTFLSAVDRQEEEQRLLQLMVQRVGHKQISLSHATAITAPWLVDASFTRELSNWKEAYEIIPLDRLPPNANYIRSHAFRHVKRATDDETNSSLRLKTRIVLHGNEDNERDDVRKDTQAASFTSIRTLLALAAIYHLHIACIDTKGAYLQSGRCRRDIFVRPPNEWRQVRGVAWKLLKLPYGLPDAGHQWQTVIDDFILSLEFSIIPGLPQLFKQQSDSKNPPTILAKVTDDILLVGTESALESFIQNIRASFDVGRFQYHTNMTFNGAFISIAPLGFTLDITEPLTRLRPIPIDFSRRLAPHEPITLEELTALRSLAGSLNYIGQAAGPPATYVASAIQQFIGRTNNI